ncbi:MAG TPA: XdhC family protein, partial [Woeseiaceae bacterium]|nr:XdhC family protein [Woeseiaceae bacterium]
MTVKALQESFASWRTQQEPLVLATVYETAGSTYSKAGARMLITGDGRFQGMLSGGCLEGDLALRAEAVLASNEPQCVTYDLGQNDEELWGLGVGCDGLMRVFLQPLRPEQDYQPFTAMAAVFAGDEAGAAATVLHSSHPGIASGATCVVTQEGTQVFGLPPASETLLAPGLEAALAGQQLGAAGLEMEGHALEILFTPLQPPPWILVLGAGLDAEPVVRLASELGWRATVQDHRPAYIENGNFSAAEQVLCEPAEALAGKLGWHRYRAVIVMSHHLDTDRKYLAQLAATDIPYIGLLGPHHRRRRLLDELGADAAAALEPRLHGPAG